MLFSSLLRQHIAHIVGATESVKQRSWQSLKVSVKGCFPKWSVREGGGKGAAYLLPKLQLCTVSFLHLNPSLKIAQPVPKLIGYLSHKNHWNHHSDNKYIIEEKNQLFKMDYQWPLNRCLLNIWDLDFSMNSNSSE